VVVQPGDFDCRVVSLNRMDVAVRKAALMLAAVWLWPAPRAAPARVPAMTPG
jgi:hypothetical protein